MKTHELTPEELRGVQKTELALLREIDRICRANEIPYVIIAGTLLGAVRHGGFIPWDDDADVAMLRPDYERFAAACRRELGEAFLFQDHRCCPGYRWGYGKLRCRDSLFLRRFQENMPYEQGIFVDVFPLDGVPDSQLGRSVMNLRCFLLRKCLWSRVGKQADGSAGARMLYRLLDRIPEQRLLARLDRLIAGCPTDTAWVRILMFPTPNRRYGYRKSWYEQRQEIRFEGQCFPGIREWDAYLRFKYGDYHRLPPESRRKCHPVSALRLPKQETGGEL